MERHFDEELRELKEMLLRMASMAEESISRAVKSLKDRDEKLVQSVFSTEEDVNLLDIKIDELCLKLLALRQPLAADLRFITSCMKITSDLERIADLSVNIVERTLELIKEPLLKPLIDIPRMAALVQKMVKDTIDAFVNRDDVLALSVCQRDDEIDDLNNQVFRELLTYMISDPRTIKRALSLILVGRYLERIADHATNIAEDVIYYVKGKTIKHHFEANKT